MHKCSCGYQSSNSFSMLLTNMSYDQQHICPCDNSSSKSPTNNVDCTLSLATPSSTRFSTSDHYYDSQESRSSSRFCWDFLHSDNHHSALPPPPPSYKGASNRGGVTTADSLLVRRCASCDTTSTPLWRNGPRGPKSLCNACGIRFKKEEKRAAMTAVVGSGGDGTDGNIWMNSPAAHKLPSCYSRPTAAVGGEFRFIDDVDDRDSSLLSWRLNVTDRPGLVHDFTHYY